MAKTVLADIRNNKFPPLTIEEGTFVIWRNLDPYAHSAETLRNSPDYFSAGALLPGEASSPVFFQKPGRFEYLCRYHAGMTGVVNVTARGAVYESETLHDHGGGHGGHLKHLHGFVTGGRSAQCLFMTHTPVLADERHHFQVILQGSLPEKAHADAYEKLRNSAYGDGKVQVFHEHLSLPDIGSGQVTTLPQSALEYYPNDPEGVLGGESVPGLEENIPVRIDKVLHFHRFETDADYPDGLTYLVYGDMDDVFIDHFIDRAPSFHSVAKLKTRPDFFTGDSLGTTAKVSIPAKRIRDVSPKFLRRVAFVDNSFHLFWLPPPGVYPLPQDPLRRRDGSAPNYEVTLDDGGKGQIEIGRFLHFDVRLLNYGVLIT
jgi:hypothetical protein